MRWVNKILIVQATGHGGHRRDLDEWETFTRNTQECLVNSPVAFKRVC